MWDELSPEDQLKLLTNFAGTYSQRIDHDLIHDCEGRLSNDQRIAYVDYMSGTIADLTYRRIDPEHPDAATQYYFNMMRAPLPLKAKMLWCAFTGSEP